MKLPLITPSLVTYTKGKPVSRGYIDARIREINALGLKEISLFVTGYEKKGRDYVHEKLKTTGIVSIPHVHIRADQTEHEVRHYMETYGTRRFTTHYEYIPYFTKFSADVRACIGIENNNDFKLDKKLDRFGGLVIDLSHYVDVREQGIARDIERALERLPVLVNHASAVTAASESRHFARSVQQYAYLRTMPKKCFSEVVSLEIGNTLAAQLSFIPFIKKQLARV
ncbi:hypothetical protein BK004_04105 [bacterium CG10_46_32]|nr:MAG: hypothetical protein BK004_04105 [bacterium CG10_46_32]PIR55802.1 MAG: hypothetical protein COU73_04145 [Parcubacteria group bacterium CG10_big_fil_rev_8_21_14_0_10_46_32]